jgi:hypothetical protein
VAALMGGHILNGSYAEYIRGRASNVALSLNRIRFVERRSLAARKPTRHGRELSGISRDQRAFAT